MIHRRINNGGYEETGRRTTDPQHQYWLDYFNAGDSWRLFRIMAEFVEGFDTLSGIKGPAVSFFGSARTKPEDPDYKRFFLQGGIVRGSCRGIVSAPARAARRLAGMPGIGSLKTR